MIEEITYDFTGNRLYILMADGTSQIYGPGDSAQYLEDHPDRGADLDAMGWAHP